LQDWWGGILFLLASAAGLFLGKGTLYSLCLFPAVLLLLFPAVSIYGTKRAAGIMFLFASISLPAYVVLDVFPLQAALPLYAMIFSMYGITEYLKRKLSRKASVFLDCIKQVGSTSSVEEACVPALQLVRRLLPDCAPAIALYDEKNKFFRLMSGHDEYTGEGVDPNGTLPLGDNICSRVFLSSKPIVVDDVRVNPLYKEGLPGARSELTVPIVWRGEKNGVINVESRKLGRFSSSDVNNLQFFAAILGEIFSHLMAEQKLENNIKELEQTNRAYLSAQKALSCALDVTREQKTNLEFLIKKFRDLFDIVQGMSYCHSVEELFPFVSQQLSQRLGYKNVYVFSRRSFSKEMSLQSWVGKLPEECKNIKGLKRGILTYVLETGKPYLATDVSKDALYVNLDNDVRSELIIPVLSSNGTWGAIAVDDDKIGGITHQDQEFLGVIATHLALELENIESFRCLNLEVNRLKALLDIVQSLSNEKASFKQVSNHVMRMLTSVFSYEKVTIFAVEKKEVEPPFLRALASNFVGMSDLDHFSERLHDIGGGQVARCVELEQIINTPDLKKSPYYVNLSSKNTTSQLDVPIIFGGEVYAVISIERNSPFEKSDEDFFMILSRHLGALLALQKIFEDMKRKALVDDLTQLWNRRFLSMRLAEEQSRYERNGEVVSVVMVDMVDFKKINDTYGHIAGDKVLKVFASLLGDSIRAGDIAGRFGGDEFLLILPGTSKEQAIYLIKRLQRNLTLLSIKGVESEISADFGIATVPEDSFSLHEALKIADNRMYESKEERRRLKTDRKEE